MSHLKYEIERIRHDPHDKLLKISPFCSEPAAAVSITCQETPKRTASPFHELESRTNEMNHFSASRTTEDVHAVFLAAPNKDCSGPLNLFGTYRYADLCSLTCVADSNLPALARHVKPNNRWFVSRTFLRFVSPKSDHSRRGLTGLSLNPKP